MRKVILFAGLVLALIVFLPGSAFSATGGTDLPYKASFTGHTTLNLLTGQLHFDSIGTGTHNGLTTTVQDGYAIPDGSGGFHIFTHFTATAANGDQSFGTCAGTATTTANGDHVGTTDCLVTGGTGRFEGASGHFTATTLTTNVTIVGTTMSGDLEGTVDGVVSFG